MIPVALGESCKALTMRAPLLWPKTVTCSGSPPKLWINLLTQRRDSSWSFRPILPKISIVLLTKLERETRMTTFISSEAKQIMDRQTDKVSYKADVNCHKKIRFKDKKSLNLFHIKYIMVIFRISDSLQDKVNYILDAHWYRESTQKICRLPWTENQASCITDGRIDD